MRSITQIPVSKTHSIPLFSYSFLCVLITGLFCLLVPFFLVFTSGFFKNQVQVYQQFSVSSTSEYYISATNTGTTSGTTSIASNLNPYIPFNSNLFIKNIEMSEQDFNADGKNDQFSFQVTIQQSNTADTRLSNVLVMLFFKCKSSYLDTTAMVLYNLQGQSIRSIVSTGRLLLVQNSLINSSESNTIYNSNPFADNYYDMETAFESYYQQATFFQKVSNQLVIDDDTNVATIKLVLNLQGQQKQLVQPGVFQQLQWSWCYYFPLAFTMGFFAVHLIDLMLKYGLLESAVRSQGLTTRDY